MTVRGYELHVIILTWHANVDIAVSAFRSGSVDFLRKPVNERELMSAIAKVAEADLCRKSNIPFGDELRRRLKTLTVRERPVFDLMQLSVGVTAISERLNISERTVYEYRTEIYHKLGTKRIADLPLQAKWRQTARSASFHALGMGARMPPEQNCSGGKAQSQ